MASDTLEKNFDFRGAEPRLYRRWEEEGMFKADPERPGDPFCMVIPPPNVTGNLHMGHALDVTLQDILARYRRMRGDNALWVPGTDHAGIATQAVVERSLASEGKSRLEMGREAFVERVWEWKRAYGGNIVRQLRRLGASLDWSRERFTMDEGLSRAVREVFVSLYESDLIYRGERIINWCVKCGTAVSDIEVEHDSRSDRLYYIRYPLIASGGQEGALEEDAAAPKLLVVATTRPETLFGDTAVAVHPDDPLRERLSGLKAAVPLTGREVPIIFDPYVDPQFGTGRLKVTPAHDANDFELGRRHGLPSILAIGEDGLLTKACGQFAGLDRLEARDGVVAALEEKGFLEKAEPLEHAVGLCYRCHSEIEPMVSMQWFVRAAPLAAEAAKAVRDGRTAIYPPTWEKTYFEWLDNIRDWCVSRQLWWGHQIPAWHCPNCSAVVVDRSDPGQCPNCRSQMARDPDVLDTWFSSALWPFSTLGWPDKTPDLARWYPTSVLVTGFDILFFWVARMMMMGLKVMGEVPFRKIVLHPLVRDADGQKMSKSKGNVVDPLDVIGKSGADAFRFTLAAQAGPARDLRLSAQRVEGYSKFVNKIWNAARFILGAAEGQAKELLAAPPAPPKALPDRWIRSRLASVAKEIAEALDNFHFDRYCELIYQFAWYEMCDWYLELAKPILYGSSDPEGRRATLQSLCLVLSEVLALLHPAMPFVTEELFGRLSDSPLMLSPFPVPREADADPEAERQVGFLMDLTKAVRQQRSDFGVPPAAKVAPIVSTQDAALAELLSAHSGLLLRLMGAESLGLNPPGGLKPPSSAANILSWGEVWTPLAGHVDPAAEEARLGKELGKIEKEIAQARSKLQNPGYLSKAPAEVVEETREKLAELEKRGASVNKTLALLSDLGGGGGQNAGGSAGRSDSGPGQEPLGEGGGR